MISPLSRVVSIDGSSKWTDARGNIYDRFAKIANCSSLAAIDSSYKNCKSASFDWDCRTMKDSFTVFQFQFEKVSQFRTPFRGEFNKINTFKLWASTVIQGIKERRWKIQPIMWKFRETKKRRGKGTPIGIFFSFLFFLFIFSVLASKRDMYLDDPPPFSRATLCVW